MSRGQVETEGGMDLEELRVVLATRNRVPDSDATEARTDDRNHHQTDDNAYSVQCGAFEVSVLDQQSASIAKS